MKFKATVFGECYARKAAVFNTFLTTNQLALEWLTMGRTMMCLKNVEMTIPPNIMVETYVEIIDWNNHGVNLQTTGGNRILPHE